MKIVYVLLLLFPLSLISNQMNSQNTAHTFDFWLGEWDAHWSDSLRGSNSIKKNLKENVVEENFSFNDASFFGKSWSVFNINEKIWYQTWVDDAGAYLTLKGGQVDESVILEMTDKKIQNGKTVYMRMIFYNITENSFDWDWQSSEDRLNWKTVWAIHYTRKK